MCHYGEYHVGCNGEMGGLHMTGSREGEELYFRSLLDILLKWGGS